MSDNGNMEIKCEEESISIEDVFSETVSNSDLMTSNSDYNHDFVQTNSYVNRSTDNENNKSTDEYYALNCDADNTKTENVFEGNSQQIKFEDNCVVSVQENTESNSQVNYDTGRVTGTSADTNCSVDTKNNDCNEECTPEEIEEIADGVQVEIRYASQTESEHESEYYYENNNNELETDLNSENVHSNRIVDQMSDDLIEHYEREEKIQRLMLIDTEQILKEVQSEETKSDKERDKDEENKVKEEKEQVCSKTLCKGQDSLPKTEVKEVVRSDRTNEGVDESSSADMKFKRQDQSTEDHDLEEERRQRLTFWDCINSDLLSRVCDSKRKRKGSDDSDEEIGYKKSRT